MKSESGSTAQIKAKGKCRLSRITDNRDIVIRSAEQDDLKWFWVAYNKGDFKGLITEGLNKDDFLKELFSELNGAIDIFILEAKNDISNVVGCVVLINRGLREEYYEPFFTWFNWATDRNKIETAAKAIIHLRKDFKNLFIQSQDEGKKFVTHIAKYGILRRVGTLNQGDKEIFLFESMRIK